MPLIEIQLLGPPVVTINGVPPPADLLWRKHLALCVVLWSAPEHRYSRNHLIGLLWGRKSQPAARHSLNEALRVIRRAAGDDAIRSSVDGIGWHAPISLDTSRFTALETTDPATAAELIRGDYCSGLEVSDAGEFEQWLDNERRHWRSRLVAALIGAAERLEDRGAMAGALSFARRATAIAPLSDAAARAVIRAHWLSGDRSGALGLGAEFSDRIVRDLGVSPDDRTQALMRRIGRETHRGAGRVAPTQHRPPLCGRDRVMSELNAAWRNAIDQARPAIIVVSGAPGSGRSRVLMELAERAVLADATVARVRAFDVDRDDSTAMFLGLAASGLHLAPGVSGATPAAIATFSSRLPAWNDQFGGVAADPLPVDSAFAAVVHAAAIERPVLLVIDDADCLSESALGQIVVTLRHLHSARVVVALGINRHVVTPSLDELRRAAGSDADGTLVQLEPLDQVAIESLVADAVPEWDTAARGRLMRRLAADCGGLPAIAVAILAAVVEGLEPYGDAARWPAPDHTLDATMPAAIPEALVAAVRVSFRAIATAGQEVLKIGAVMREPFTPEQLGTLVSHPESMDVVLDQLEATGWLVSDGRGYSFVARAVRRLVADEMMTPGARRRLEERLTLPR